ncbi:hypothetical protein LguiA_011945 [Lonicera macranthoides]
MFRSREKSLVPIYNPSPIFSFKDIQYLCSSDNSSSDRRLHSSPKPSVFHRIRRINLVLRALSSSPKTLPPPDPTTPTPRSVPESEPLISIPGAEKHVVLYLTSLRVVRSTFDDCRTVQSILNGFRVPIDERDLAMDSSFLGELKKILGHPEKTKLTLPRVFIGGRYIGGVEEVRQLHETGELKKMLKGLPAAAPGKCEGCGGQHFILCDECRGSHKCYTEKSGFRSCTKCNENGLIRCPSCSCTSI